MLITYDPGKDGCIYLCAYGERRGDLLFSTFDAGVSVYVVAKDEDGTCCVCDRTVIR
jgi:hypothetical protein